MFSLNLFEYKILFIRFFITLILIINSTIASAQFFASEQNPPGLRWREIRTGNFNILYPADMEDEAQRMANTVTSIIAHVSFDYHLSPKKITIILQNQGTTSNGFVQLAPRRSEFYTTPAQEFDYQDWLNSLAVHELRHVAQFDKLTGKLKAPFFEELGLAIFGITLPPWFYEGDAVITETALTNAGRGRQPEFDLTLRTNTLSGRKYSYSKDYFGSVKDFPPGYYTLGYYMVAKLRRDNGSDIMDSLLTRISRNPIRPYSLSSSMKKFAGLSTRQLHDSTVSELESLWRAQQQKAQPLNYPVINRRKDDEPVNYMMPVAISTDEVIALKQGKGFAPALVKLEPSGKETQILKIGPQEEAYFRYAAGKLVWDEYRSDVRYQQRSFNVINIYDLNTKRYRQVTHRTRLFAPTLSPDGKTIIAVDVSYSNIISLVSLNAETGQEIKRYSSPDNYMLQTPQFSGDGTRLICVAVSQEGKTLYELNLQSGQFTKLIPFQKQLISKPGYAGQNIVFKAHYNGIDNLYQLNPVSGNIVQLTSAKFGAFNPSYDEKNNRILFNNYQPDGYDVSFLNVQNIHPISSKSITLNYIAPVVAEESNQNVFDSIPQTKYRSRHFEEFSHLFNFHSLLPIVEEDQFLNDYNFGLKLQSDNLINTFSSYVGYRFNTALQKSEYLAGFTYSRFFPVFTIEYLNQARLTYIRASPSDKTPIPLSWRENQIEFKAAVPLNFNRRNFSYYAGTEIGTNYTSRYQLSNHLSDLPTNLSFPISYQLYLGRNQTRSARDLAPLWGQNAAIRLRHFPFENQLSGNLFTFRSTFYFPGLLPHHSFQTSFNYQNSQGSYTYAVDIPLVSGYSNLKAATELRNTLLIDYHFPIFYPDWELGPLAYIKRFSGGFFADFENIGRGNRFAPRTYGAELRTDMNLLRFYLPNFIPSAKIIFVNEKPHQNPIFEAGLTYNY